jgi:hypothetical protein
MGAAKHLFLCRSIADIDNDGLILLTMHGEGVIMHHAYWLME